MRRLVLLAVVPLLTASSLALPAALASPAASAGQPAARLRPGTVASNPNLGLDRLGVRRRDTWLLRDSLSGGPVVDSYAEGAAGWTPVWGDTNGDGTSTLSLFKDGVWHLSDSRAGAVVTVRFGMPGDIPVLGDWNGDGTATLGVFRKGRWYLRDANGAGPTSTFGFGQPGDRPVTGDWTASGHTGIGVVRGRQWFERDTADGGPSSRSFAFGLAGDLPLAGDWNHDGADTPAVFRGGTWFFHDANGPGGNQSVRFGLPGDLPVLRRTPGLTPGLTHQVLTDPSGPFVAHVATLSRSAAAGADALLAGETLGSTSPTSVMAAQSGAVLAVNGDFFLDNGRPVHVFAADGALAQTEQVHGRALGLDLSGRPTAMGFPSASVTVQPSGSTSATPLASWNSGPPTGDQVVGFTATGGSLETPPADACYAGLSPAAAPVLHPGGGVEQSLQVTGTRCGGQAPAVPPGTVVLAGLQGSAAQPLLQALTVGQQVTMNTQLGFPDATEVLGGNPVLLAGGSFTADVDGTGPFFERNPRTLVGTTADGSTLLVVVDGRRPGYSVGMTLREAADLMASLGARDAINLDGGGSSTMWLNGLVANRPSDGYERSVSTALAIFPGRDPAASGITIGAPAPSPTPTPSTSAGAVASPGASATPATSVTPASTATPGVSTSPGASVAPALTRPALTRVPAGGSTVPGWDAVARDPASTGGLAAAMRRAGIPLTRALQRAADAFAQG